MNSAVLFRRTLVVLAAFAGGLAGCELVVDFDRNKIDSGSIDASVADVNIDQTVPAGDGGDAGDGGPDASPDGQVDAPADAPTDAPGDAPQDVVTDAPDDVTVDAPDDADDSG